MSEITYCALPFVPSDHGVAPADPVECFNPSAAVMRAEALSRQPSYVGAVAFSRTGDPATGVLEQLAPRRRYDAFETS
jgi:hypothetical protein